VLAASLKIIPQRLNATVQMKIDQFYLFTKLSSDSLKQLEMKIFKIHYKRDSIIFYHGDNSDHLHMLVGGMVKIYKHNQKNSELIIKYFEAPALIGEMATFEKIPFPASCSAQSDVEMWKLKRDDFVELLKENPSLSMEIISSMSKKIKNLERNIESNLTKNATQRVVATILETPLLFENISNMKIASMLNMKPETLSRVLKKLKDLKLIEINHSKIVVIDMQKLRSIL
jgi:CRP-like cAMP-binding protein